MSCRKRCGCDNQHEISPFLFNPTIIPKRKSKSKTSDEIYGDQVYPSDIHITIAYTGRDMIGNQSYDAPQDTPRFMATRLDNQLRTRVDSDPPDHHYIDPKTLSYYQNITSTEKYKNLRVFNLRWQLFDVKKENLNKKYRFIGDLFMNDRLSRDLTDGNSTSGRFCMIQYPIYFVCNDMTTEMVVITTNVYKTTIGLLPNTNPKNIQQPCVMGFVNNTLKLMTIKDYLNIETYFTLNQLLALSSKRSKVRFVIIGYTIANNGYDASEMELYSLGFRQNLTINGNIICSYDIRNQKLENNQTVQNYLATLNDGNLISCMKTANECYGFQVCKFDATVIPKRFSIVGPFTTNNYKQSIFYQSVSPIKPFTKSNIYITNVRWFNTINQEPDMTFTPGVIYPIESNTFELLEQYFDYMYSHI